jgi:hypothetical protein
VWSVDGGVGARSSELGAGGSEFGWPPAQPSGALESRREANPSHAWIFRFEGVLVLGPRQHFHLHLHLRRQREREGERER